jgi:CheY-like chemotaxis protein
MKPLALVIENDRGTRRLLDVLLQRLRFEVDVVTTTAEALLLLEHVEYNLVFVDPRLTAIAGQDVLSWIAERCPAVLSRCVVLWSAAPKQLEHVRDQYPTVRTLRKPFELSAVIEIADTVATDAPRRMVSGVEELTRRSVAAGAKAGFVATITAGGILPVMWFGYDRAMIDSFAPIPLEAPTPISAAVRDGRPVWLTSLPSVAHDYPHLAPIWEKLNSRALAAVPVVREGVVLGAAGWTFPEPRVFEEPEQQALLAIANALARTFTSGAPG